MADSKITGYKKVFGLVLPEWISEKMIKNIVMGSLAVASMFLLLIFVVMPNFEVIKTRKLALEQSRDSLEVLRESKEGLDRLNQDLTADEQRRVLLAIPQVYSPESAIFMLRRISADTGVSIVSYSLPSGVLLDQSVANGTPVGTDMVNFSAFPIRLSVAAPVDALLRFVATVESSLPFGVVSDLNLQEVTKLSRTVGDKTVQLALEIRFFQSTLNRVNLSRLESLSPEDIQLAKTMANFNLLTIPDTGNQTGDITASGSGSVFGF